MARWVRGIVQRWGLVGLGLLLLGAALEHLLHAGNHDDLLIGTLEVALSAALSSTVVGFGLWLRRRYEDPWRLGRIAAWAAAGALGMAANGAWLVALLAIQGEVIADPGFIVVGAAATGAVGGMLVGYYHDRTAVAARELARERGETLDEFASVVSHDLRNPLSVAAGYLELARETGDPEHFDRIERAHERMAQLVEDVLALARGRRAATPEPVHVGAIADQAAGAVRLEGAIVEIDADLTVEAAPGRLRTLFENLFRNSVEHGFTGRGSGIEDSGGRSSTDGGTVPGDDGNRGLASGRTAPDEGAQRERDAADGRPRADEDGGIAPEDPVRCEPGVRIRVGLLPRDAGFYVADDGPGIPETDRERVFERSYTTSSHGTGLGLTIVRETVEAHGWTVRVVDAVGGGARFEVLVDGSGAAPGTAAATVSD
jgi:signal transduction histidine kinase